MGNRTHLFFGNYCEFEANNCLPVTWLALFDTREFLIEAYVEEPVEHEQFDGTDKKPEAERLQGLLSKIEHVFKRGIVKSSSGAVQPQEPHAPQEYFAAGYRTSQSKALQRVEMAIGKLKGHTPVWTFLRPLEILRDELKLCPQDAILNLDLTQLWAMNETFNQRVTQAVAAFTKMLNELTGQEEQDLSLLSQLVNDFTLGSVSSVADLDPEERMFVLIGTYWGDEERENLYSLEYFNEAYWIGT
jgi:hypothetical protein